tara:strand:- start:167 stop:427 length:261 start_codon:yes stop_codon:yes gene_type:complete
MDELMDMITKDDSPSQVSDAIKDALYAKSAERIGNHKNAVANSLFGHEPETEDDIQLQKDVEGYADTIAGTDREEPEVELESEDEE